MARAALLQDSTAHFAYMINSLYVITRIGPAAPAIMIGRGLHAVCADRAFVGKGEAEGLSVLSRSGQHHW